VDYTRFFGLGRGDPDRIHRLNTTLASMALLPVGMLNYSVVAG
jgi:hypothetical protein